MKCHLTRSLHAFAVLCALLLCACQPAPHAVSGVALRDACTPLEEGAVELRGTAQRAALDTQGRFEFADAPEFGVLAVSAIGYSTTRSVSRRLSSAQPYVVLPEGVVAGLYPLANLAPIAGRGTVVLTFADAVGQPVGDVVVKVTSVEGAAEGASFGQVRFLERPDEDTPRITASRTATADTGVFLVFNAQPGWYRLQAERDGVSWPPTQLLVEADGLTADVVHAAQSLPLRAARVHGTVTGTPPWPRGDVASIPIAGATVRVGGLEAVTDASGAYSVELSMSASGESHLTVDASGYPRALGAALCLGPGKTLAVDVVLPDDVSARWQMLPALEGQPLDAQRGHVVVHLRRQFLTGEVPLSGAVVELVGASAAFYGHAGADAECAPGPSPACTACDASGACPTDSEPVQLAGGCRCLVTRTDCFAADQSCADGNFCHVTFGNAMGTRVITRQVCRPLGPRFTDAALGYALFANVPPGDYLLRGQHADGPLLPRRVRVEAGAFSATSLNLFTRAPLPGEL